MQSLWGEGERLGFSTVPTPTCVLEKGPSKDGTLAPEDHDSDAPQTEVWLGRSTRVTEHERFQDSRDQEGQVVSFSPWLLFDSLLLTKSCDTTSSLSMM